MDGKSCNQRPWCCDLLDTHSYQRTKGQNSCSVQCWWWVTCSIAVGQGSSWLIPGIRKAKIIHHCLLYSTYTFPRTMMAPRKGVKPKGSIRQNSKPEGSFWPSNMYYCPPTRRTWPPGYNRVLRTMYIHADCSYRIFLTEAGWMILSPRARAGANLVH